MLSRCQRTYHYPCLARRPLGRIVIEVRSVYLLAASALGISAGVGEPVEAAPSVSRNVEVLGCTTPGFATTDGEASLVVCNAMRRKSAAPGTPRQSTQSLLPMLASPSDAVRAEAAPAVALDMAPTLTLSSYSAAKDRRATVAGRRCSLRRDFEDDTATQIKHVTVAGVSAVA